jgi:hypothetical protein
MNYFVVELRHGESKQVWIACCEMEAEALELVQEAAGALPNAGVESKALDSEPPFPLKPDTAEQWL